jgi:hypothetical protein
MSMGLWDRLLEDARRSFGALRQESKRATEQARLRLDKAKLQREQEKALARLGRDVLDLHKLGMPLHDSLIPAILEVTRVEEAIAEKDAALRQVAEGAKAAEAPGEASR